MMQSLLRSNENDARPTKRKARLAALGLVAVVGVIGVIGVMVATHTPEPYERSGEMSLKSRLVGKIRGKLPFVAQDSGNTYGPFFEGDLRIPDRQKRDAYGNHLRYLVDADAEKKIAAEKKKKEGKEDYKFLFNEGEDMKVAKNGLTSIAARKWPGGVMYYRFNNNLPGALKNDMVWAMHHIECHVPGIKFRVRTNQANWVDIRLDPNANGYCWSNSIGMRGGRQEIGGKSCGRGVAVHEIMHALGFWHEQSRPDRDQFLNVYLNNVREARFRHNFAIQRNINSRRYPFDYQSLMEYAHWAFAKRGTSTLRAKNGESLGQYNGMTGNDALQARAMYEPSNVFIIRSVHSGKVMDVSGWGRHNGANIHQWSYHGGRNQMWIVPAINQWVSVKSVHSGGYMDISGFSRGNGGNLHQWAYHGGANQQFRFEPLGHGQYRIRARISNKFLDVSGWGRHNGANIHQWSWHGGNNQRWTLQAAPRHHHRYFISCVHSAKVMDVAGWGRHNGANVHQWALHGGNNQIWIVPNINGGVTYIQSLHNHKVVDVSGWGRHNGANVHMWQWHGGNNQKWRFSRLSNGKYRITSVHSGKVLDVSGWSMSNGGNIHQWQWHGGKNQQWDVIPVPHY